MMKKQTVLRGEKVRLGILSDADKETMLDILSNEEVGLTYMLPLFQERTEAIPLFQRLKQLSEDPCRFVYGIYLQDNLIGWLNEVDVQNMEIEVGYVIHPFHKSKGYATDALKTAIQELFRLGFSAVRAAAFEDNKASFRVMAKAGMSPIDCSEDLTYRDKLRHCPYCEIRNPRV